MQPEKPDTFTGWLGLLLNDARNGRMAIPSKEDFDEILGLLANFGGAEVKSNPNEVEFNFDAIRDFYLEIFSLVGAKRKVIDNTPVKKWLNSQKSYTLGLKSAFKRQASFTDKDWFEKNQNLAISIAESCLEAYRPYTEDEYLYLITLNSEEVEPGLYLTSSGTVTSSVDQYNNMQMHVFHHNLQNETAVLYGRWFNRFITSLNEYFYGESELISENNYYKSLAELQSFSDALENLNKSIPHSMRYFSLDQIVNKELFNVTKEIEIKEAFATPIKKNNETVKERALAYELWQAFEKQGLGRKTAAITHFLSLEGIANSVDKRTTERNISGWERDLVRYNEEVKEIDSE